MGEIKILSDRDGVYEVGSVINVLDFICDWMDCCTDDSLKDWIGRIPIKNAVHFVCKIRKSPSPNIFNGGMR